MCITAPHTGRGVESMRSTNELRMDGHTAVEDVGYRYKDCAEQVAIRAAPLPSARLPGGLAGCTAQRGRCSPSLTAGPWTSAGAMVDGDAPSAVPLAAIHNLPPEEKPIELHTGSPDTSFDRLSSTSGRLARRILKASPRTDQPR